MEEDIAIIIGLTAMIGIGVLIGIGINLGSGISVEHGTLNQICADYNGPQYMYDKIQRINNQPDKITCKLRPQYLNEQIVTTTK